MYVTRNNEARSRKQFCIEKALSITYSKCLCVCSVIHPARKSHRRLILPAVTRLILSYFPILGYIINCTIFGKSLLNLILYTDFLCSFCLKHL